MKKLFTLIAVIFSLSLAASADGEINLKKPGLFGGSWSHALNGYDTVSYFTDGKATKGKKDFSAEYKGAKWLFSSAENRDLFNASPEKYAPQYGGYCAWAVAHDSPAPGNPKVWKIVDNKLYVNYDKSIGKKWEKDIPALVERADTNWPGVKERLD